MNNYLKRGEVIAVCRSQERGFRKGVIDEGYLKEDYGLIGDAHAGTEKQVSLLMQEIIDRFNRERDLTASSGDFAENITTKGIDLLSLQRGTRIKIGQDAILQIIRFGKTKQEIKHHSFSYKGYSLLATQGVFARVIKSGRIKKQDPISVAQGIGSRLSVKSVKSVNSVMLVN